MAFEVGDRVRVCTSGVVPLGTLGRVQATLIHARDLCIVQFDGEERLTLMHVFDLEPVADEGAE